MSRQVGHSLTDFAKRGAMQHFLPLHPVKFEVGHHMHMFSSTPQLNFENGALPVNIFPCAPVEVLEARRYLQISSPTPRLAWSGELHIKFIIYAPMQSESNAFQTNFFCCFSVFWTRSNLLWCFNDFLIYTSRYNYRRKHFFLINGMFPSVLTYSLHATVIDKITFPLKMVCF